MTRRFRLSGLIAVLLALIAQLGGGASVPRIDPFRAIGAFQVLCRSDDGGAAADQAPGHPADCLVCPLCVALHSPPAMLGAGSVPVPLPTAVFRRFVRVLPPSTAPPSSFWSASQPRAPPVGA